jgi:hypothetical protein
VCAPLIFFARPRDEGAKNIINVSKKYYKITSAPSGEKILNAARPAKIILQKFKKIIFCTQIMECF